MLIEIKCVGAVLQCLVIHRWLLPLISAKQHLLSPWPQSMALSGFAGQCSAGGDVQHISCLRNILRSVTSGLENNNVFALQFL